MKKAEEAMTLDATAARATPRPWSHRGPWIRYANDQELLARRATIAGGVEVNTIGRSGTWEADAALIVLAVNHIEQVVEALRALVEHWEAGDIDRNYDAISVAFDDARAVLRALAAPPAALRAGDPLREALRERWDSDEEHCQSCGKAVALIWWASDETWTAVTGTTDGSGIRCVRCFDEEAEAKGIGPFRWVPEALAATGAGE